MEFNLIESRYMRKILFSDRYGLTGAVLDGRKTMTRRIIPKDIAETLIIKGDGIFPDIPCEGLMEYSRYKVGEMVAVAQNYKDVREGGYPVDSRYDAFREADWGIGVNGALKMSAGETNKMFVKADLMPHRIRIVGIRVERLQDIGGRDFFREGIYSVPAKEMMYSFDGCLKNFPTPHEAFAALIDKVSGKGTWESNPYVWVYSFELIK